jgi:hypothetical protein
MPSALCITLFLPAKNLSHLHDKHCKVHQQEQLSDLPALAAEIGSDFLQFLISHVV